MRVQPIFRNLPSCTLVLDFGSLHQKPLILYIEMRLCWFATDPEHNDDFLSVPCFLMPQNSLLTLWRFSQKLKIHGLHSDACTLDTCSMTDDQVTCFVMHADTLTMLCREGDVEANDNFQRQFSPSCKIFKMSFENSMILRAALSGSFFYF